LFSDILMPRKEEVSEVVGLSLCECEGRVASGLLPDGILPLGGPVEAGRRLRPWWNMLERMVGGPIMDASVW
jgi:hypothetical protein